MSTSELVDRNRAAFAHGESRQAHQTHSSKRVWTGPVCRWVASHLRPGDRVLDIGGGGGFKATLLCDLVDVTVIGLDVSPESLRERFQDPRLTRNLVASMDTLPLASGSLDAVVFFGALHHTAEPLKALREVFRVLRPGARVLLIEPNSLAMRVRGSGMEPANQIEFRFCLPFVRAQLALSGFELDAAFTEVIASRLIDRLPGGTSYIGRRIAFEIDRHLLRRTPVVRQLGAAMYLSARRPGSP